MNNDGSLQLDGNLAYGRAQEQPPRPWRILSLDGGGVKGLAELLVLERLFRRIRDDAGLPDDADLRPCDYFDLIGGTSTGGLVALLLGRMRMTVPEAIYHFKDLSGKIFKGTKPGGIRKAIKAGVGVSYFDGDNMTKAVKRLLMDKPEMDLRERPDPACKVFVVSTNQLTSSKILLRSYYNGAANQDNIKCTVWQAARATSAAPLYFPALKLERLGQTTMFLCDGGLNNSRVNNPIFEVMSEASRLDPHRGIGCVVSIGTGRTDSLPTGSKAHQVIQNCIAIALHSHEESEQYVQSDQGYRLRDADRYFRFDPWRRVGEIALEDWRKLDDMESFMKDEYLRLYETGREIKKCAEKLRAVTTNEPTQIAMVAHQMPQFDRSDRAAEHVARVDTPRQGSNAERQSPAMPTNRPQSSPSRLNHPIDGGQFDIDEYTSSAFKHLEDGHPKLAYTALHQALSLFHEHWQNERQDEGRMVTVLLGLAYCHHQKAVSVNETQARKAAHLESANHYIQRASAITNLETFDLLRVQLYSLLHEITALIVTTGIDNIHPNRKATLCGRLDTLHQRFEDSQRHRSRPLAAMYQDQIRRKLEMFEWI